MNYDVSSIRDLIRPGLFGIRMLDDKDYVWFFIYYDL